MNQAKGGTVSAQHKTIYDDETGMLTLPEAERRKLHFNRGINLDTILMLLTMLAGSIWWAMGQNDRVTKNTSDIQKNSADIIDLRDQNKAQDFESNRRQDQILAVLNEQNKKMDAMLLNQRRGR